MIFQRPLDNKIQVISVLCIIFLWTFEWYHARGANGHIWALFWPRTFSCLHQTLGSYFLTRPNVENFCDALCTATSLIDPAKWIHIPIDGHNTCWAVFNVIHGEWERTNFLILLILEAVDCMHDALQDGAKAPSICLLAKVLSTMYKVLKHFPVSVFDNISYYTSYNIGQKMIEFHVYRPNNNLLI